MRVNRSGYREGKRKKRRGEEGREHGGRRQATFMATTIVLVGSFVRSVSLFDSGISR